MYNTITCQGLPKKRGGEHVSYTEHCIFRKRAYQFLLSYAKFLSQTLTKKLALLYLSKEVNNGVG